MVLRFAGCTIKRLEESSLFILSRCDKISTCDLCVPNAALYQAEPRIERNFISAFIIILDFGFFSSSFSKKVLKSYRNLIKWSQGIKQKK